VARPYAKLGSKEAGLDAKTDQVRPAVRRQVGEVEGGIPPEGLREHHAVVERSVAASELHRDPVGTQGREIQDVVAVDVRNGRRRLRSREQPRVAADFLRRG
jgi:hypothetical protein